MKLWSRKRDRRRQVETLFDAMKMIAQAEATGTDCPAPRTLMLATASMTIASVAVELTDDPEVMDVIAAAAETVKKVADLATDHIIVEHVPEGTIADAIPDYLLDD